MERRMRGALCMAAMALMVFAAGQAQALSAGALVVSGPNQFSDEDREYLIDKTRTATGQIDVGDVLRGAINLNTLNSTGANLGGTTPNDELTGVFEVMVTGKTGSGASTAFTYGPSPTFTAIYGPGAMAAIFDDPTKDFAADFNNPGAPVATDDGTPSRTVPPSSADVSTGPYASEEAFIATAADGSLFLTLGFLGLPGEGGSGVGSDNVLNAFAITSGSTLGLANFGMNVITYGPAWPSLATISRVTPTVFGGTADVAFSQDIRGVSDLDTAFEISTNTNGSFNATVIPEPTTMLLLGSGLLGLGYIGRRRTKV